MNIDPVLLKDIFTVGVAGFCLSLLLVSFVKG